MYKGGYTGKVLRINLTHQSAQVETLPVDMAIKYIGGAGFGAKYLFDELPPRTAPLGHENKLIFAVGPFTGTTVPSASRLNITAKSPLTHTIGSALSGGYFPVELKFAGYDALIIEGKAKAPTYIWIKDADVQFKSAGKLWGLKTSDCQQVIKDDLKDQNIRCVCIGPAGENLVKLACIMNEKRAAGRKGLGAVMGSKNLKAIAIRGTGQVKVADNEKFKAARRQMTAAMKESPVLYPVFSKVGSSCALDATADLGVFSAKNWTATGSFVPKEGIGLEAQAKAKVGNTRCYNCPVGCSQLMLARTGSYAGILTEGPEFETQYSYGGQTGVDNLDAIIAADHLSDELGIDTISAGVAIGFAMELFERGILTTDDFGGLSPAFGNHEAMLALLKMIAYRQGIGDLLAEGTKAAAEKIGKGTDRCAMHVKGLELPAYDVRGAKAHALNYATAYSGADHNKGYSVQEIFNVPIPYGVDRFSYENKGKLCKWNQDIQCVLGDCTTICSFVVLLAMLPNGLKIVADILEGLTGLQFTPDDIYAVGERVNNLCRAFNVREGFTRRDDTLPKRLMTEPIPEGPSKGQRISQEDLDHMLDDYYKERGWDLKTGAPTKETLNRLGLDFAAEQLNP